MFVISNTCLLTISASPCAVNIVKVVKLIDLSFPLYLTNKYILFYIFALHCPAILIYSKYNFHF